MCPLGTYCVKGSPAPVPCSAGTFGSQPGLTAADQCTTCPRGSWCGNGIRISCPRNSFNPVTAASDPTACQQCPEHSQTASDQSKSEDDCLCKSGFASTLLNGTPDGLRERVCQCGAGFGLVREYGSARCERCPAGFYKPRAGNIECTKCAQFFSTTILPGTIHADDCICQSSFFSASDSNGTLECVPCGTVEERDGATNCTNAGMILDQLPVSRGYFRQGSTARYVRACPKPGFCQGGLHVDSQCISGHRGPYCLVCSEKYTMAIDKSCTLCEGNPALSIALQVSGSVAVLVALMLAYLYYLRRGFKTTWTLISLSGRLSVKIRIMTSLMQISGSFGGMFKIEYPGTFASVLEQLSAVLTLDFAKLLPMDCIFPVDYVSSTVLRTALITVVVGFLYVLAWLLNNPPDDHYTHSHSKCERRPTVFKGSRHASVFQASRRATVFKGSQCAIQNASGHGSTSDTTSTQPTPLTSDISAICSTAAFYIVYLAYPGVMQTLFNFFQCDKWDEPGENGRSYLREDLSIECDSEYYQRWKVYVIFMVFLYPFGVPLFYACIFFRNRVELKELRTTELIQSTEKLRKQLLLRQEDAIEKSLVAQDKREALKHTQATADRRRQLNVLKRFGQPKQADCTGSVNNTHSPSLRSSALTWKMRLVGKIASGKLQAAQDGESCISSPPAGAAASAVPAVTWSALRRKARLVSKLAEKQAQEPRQERPAESNSPSRSYVPTFT